MLSLSDRAKGIVPFAENERMASRMLAHLTPDLAISIENMTQVTHNLASTVERLQLRIEELEAQVAQLLPPKEIGPCVRPAWKTQSGSDIKIEELPPKVRDPGW